MAIYALIGHSASGKSSIERMLTNMGYPRIISYTTRPMREKENQGVDYHFVDTYTFMRLQDEDFFAETARYREWFYGLSLDEIDYENKDYIVVVTINGYEELVKTVGDDNITAIHIYVPERERIIRQLRRGDEVDEVIRRIQTDRVDFGGVEDTCQHIINNVDLDESVNKIHVIIGQNRKAKKSISR